MKLILNCFKPSSLVKLLVILLIISQSRADYMNKLLFKFDHPLLASDMKHDLNNLDYKNIMFSKDEITVYKSVNPNEAIIDHSEALTHYLYTIRLSSLDNPCINKSYICTFSQLKKEFTMFYPEMKFDIPKPVLEKFGDAAKAGDQCILIIQSPVMDLTKAGWLCHEDPTKLFQIQTSLSEDIKGTNKNDYEFPVSYIQNQATVIQGKLLITMDDWTFKKDDEVIVSSTWIETTPYVSVTFMKDTIKWTGTGAKPEEDRCFKVYRKKEIANENPDYFCVYMNEQDMHDEITANQNANGNKVNPTDIKALELAMSRFAAQTYTNKINVRLIDAIVRDNINKISALPTNTINVDSDLINPIKNQVRDDYLKERHALLSNINNKNLTPVEIAKLLDELKQKIIKDTCKAIEVCMSAMNYCIDKGLLPLSGDREKFSMDKENPYNNIAPKIPIMINLPNKNSAGKKAVDEVAKIKGSPEYFAEKLPEGQGSIPIHDDLKKAFNTLQGLKENKVYENLADVKKGCKVNERNNITNIRRRISFMMFSGDNDIFFEYFGYLRDYQFKK